MKRIASAVVMFLALLGLSAVPASVAGATQSVVSPDDFYHGG